MGERLIIADLPLTGGVRDYSGKNNHGALNGDLIRVSSPFGAGFQASVLDAAFIRLTKQLGALSAMSIRIWYSVANKTVSGTGGQYMLFTSDAGTFLALTTPNSARPAVSMTIGGTQRSCNSGFSPSLNTWHHVVGTYDGSALSIAVDGKIRGSLGGISGAVANVTTPYVGRYSTPGNAFPGCYAGLRVWGRALTAAEINQDFLSGPGAPSFAPRYLSAVEYEIWSTPAAAVSILAGVAPVVVMAGVISGSPGGAALALAGKIPLVNITGRVDAFPAPADLDITGGLPVAGLSGSMAGTPQSADLDLTGGEVSAALAGLASGSPAAAGLSLQGGAVVSAASGSAAGAPVPAVLVLGGAVPRMYIGIPLGEILSPSVRISTKERAAMVVTQERVAMVVTPKKEVEINGD